MVVVGGAGGVRTIHTGACGGEGEEGQAFIMRVWYLDPPVTV